MTGRRNTSWGEGKIDGAARGRIRSCAGRAAHAGGNPEEPGESGRGERPARGRRPCGTGGSACSGGVLASGPVSRILFRVLRRFGRHFSRRRLAPPPARSAHLSVAGCDIPVAIGRAAQPPILPCTGRGFSCRRRRRRRGGLLPHLFTLARRLPAGRFVFCDTFHRRALTRTVRTCGEAHAAPCPAVSGLSSPNFKCGRGVTRALGSKNSERRPGPEAKAADTAARLPRRKPRGPAASLGRPGRPGENENRSGDRMTEVSAFSRLGATLPAKIAQRRDPCAAPPHRPWPPCPPSARSPPPRPPP